MAYQEDPDRLKLISLTGTVVAPRPIWGWQVRPDTASRLCRSPTCSLFHLRRYIAYEVIGDLSGFG